MKTTAKPMGTKKITLHMRNLIIIPIIFAAISIKAQVFAPLGTNWYYSDQNSGAAPSNSEYIHYQSVKDTVVKGQSVRKIIRKHYHYNGDTSVLNPLYVYNSTDTVFLYNPNKDKFDKLYIFNKSKGDTITLDVPSIDNQPTLNKTVYRLVIDSIATVSYNAKFIKKYKTKPLDIFQFWNNGWYMDYVGGLDWFYPRGMIIPEAGGPLRCYSDNNLNINFSSQACDYRLISNIPNIYDKNISIFPNPATDIIHISSVKQVGKYEIFDNLGDLKITDNKTIKNISELGTGIYIVKFYFQDKTLTYKKLMKE